MCQPKQHILAKLVHKMRVFRDEDTEWVFDLQLDIFESSEDFSPSLRSSLSLSLSLSLSFGSPLSLVLAPGVFFFRKRKHSNREGEMSCTLNSLGCYGVGEPSGAEVPSPFIGTGVVLSVMLAYWGEIA